ncbi:FAD-binding oxidoreductase [Patescibacteria group bacterium]|nr:FAD-binding oxidoreductase [Patescibacteria group bacterium]
MNLTKELQAFLMGEVQDDLDTRKKYSRDTSLFEVMPRLVVFPKNVEDLSKLVKFVKAHPEERLSLTCRSGGTDMSGGALGESIIVDMSRHFTKLKELGEGYAVVEPGMFYRDFEKETLKKGLLLPSFPASWETCTVGGMAANNSAGEKTLKYGKTEDYILRLKAVLADGNEYVVEPLQGEKLKEKLASPGFEGDLYGKMYKMISENHEILSQAKPDVSKNSAGYALWNIWRKPTFDLTQLFCGSQGTLGIITEITFRLVRPAAHSALLVLFLRDIGKLAEVVERVMQYEPESFEAYDDHTLKFALMHLPDFVRLLKGNVFSLSWQFLPEFLLFLKGGFRLPKFVLLAEFTGDSELEAREKARDAENALESLSLQTHLTKSEKEVKKYFTVRRESYNLLRKHVKGKRTAPFIDDVIVKPEFLPEFLPKLTKILKRYPQLLYTVFGHAGDGNFHIIPLMNLENRENRELIFKLSQEVYELVFSYRGSMTAEHNDGIVRTPFLKAMYGAEVEKLFRETKLAFDPNDIFNPGKKVNGSVQYAIEHIAEKN